MSKLQVKEKERTFPEKLKQFFRLNKGGSGTTPGAKSKIEEFALTPELEKDIGPNSHINHRTKIIKELCDIVVAKRLEEYAVEKLWSNLNDLLGPEVAREHRHLALNFFCHLVQGQSERLGFLRANFFQFITSHEIPEDVVPRFDLLKSLTNNGRDLLYFEVELGPFLQNWMPAVIGAGKTFDLMALLLNVVKYNATYLDSRVIAGIVQHTSHVMCRSNSDDEVRMCLQVLDAILCYSTLPAFSVPIFIESLCYTLNSNTYCKTSWKLELEEGMWIVVLFNNDWWPGQVIRVMPGEEKVQIKFQLKPVAVNKFKTMEKPEFEVIDLGTYLAILLGDPPPIDSSACYFAYDKEIARKVASVVTTIMQ